MKNGDLIASNPEEIDTLFNAFFTSTKSSSLINLYEANNKIFEQFQLLKMKIFLNLNSVFSFKEVSDLDVEFVLNQISSSSAPGYNSITLKYLKRILTCAERERKNKKLK